MEPTDAGVREEGRAGNRMKTPAAKAQTKPVEQTPVAETGIDNWSLEEQHRKSTEEDQDSEEEMEKDKEQEQEKEGGQTQGGAAGVVTG